MIITLYQNSQTEAELSQQLYERQWAFIPYTSDSLFCSGKTADQADFILPVDFSFDPSTNSIRYHNKAPCILQTDKNGNPILYINSVNYLPPVILQPHNPLAPIPDADKTWPRPPPAARYSHAYVPGYDANGELEIF